MKHNPAIFETYKTVVATEWKNYAIILFGSLITVSILKNLQSFGLEIPGVRDLYYNIPTPLINNLPITLQQNPNFRELVSGIELLGDIYLQSILIKSFVVNRNKIIAGKFRMEELKKT